MSPPDWLWIPIVLVAAGLQTVRNAGQKHLGGRMATLPVTWVRFGFGLPFAVAYLAAVSWRVGSAPPKPDAYFLAMAASAAILQIAGTGLLVILFRMRNFAVGTTYVRSEVIMASLLGTLFFAEHITVFGWIAILTSFAGVAMIGAARAGLAGQTFRSLIFTPSAAIGLATGLCFALSSFSIRTASLSLGGADFVNAAALTLVAVLMLQTLGLGGFILAVRPGDFRLLARHWRLGLLVGAASAFGSAGWFTAMTIEQVSHVKALAQVEFLFALIVSVLLFREMPNRREMTGMVLTALGIVSLVIFAK